MLGRRKRRLLIQKEREAADFLNLYSSYKITLIFCRERLNDGLSRVNLNLVHMMVITVRAMNDIPIIPTSDSKNPMGENLKTK